ncbi:hypothetical protein AUEXF2481DRAFT_602601 [Aureobasidium subglaciale EXF-2481]|uniref:Uncharacterized protein n=1 Tax=Aureobasidium subglaciale (strain EXF-2481) TaxID=1043005 RepID=A0A074ZFY0_AURSE|nr:uncharacterized protein AUEXF2481DRAFT_602601 [Aureobasidium subglaciale EXF-2481]KEQ97521.1 hypothetical protein AUEXF2481DRAFT_602601 [Aureobasidium subglaciale EXF-2481]
MAGCLRAVDLCNKLWISMAADAIEFDTPQPPSHKTRGVHVATLSITLLCFLPGKLEFMDSQSKACNFCVEDDAGTCFSDSSLLLRSIRIVFLRHSRFACACLRAMAHPPYAAPRKGGYRNFGKSYPKPRFAKSISKFDDLAVQSRDEIRTPGFKSTLPVTNRTCPTCKVAPSKDCSGVLWLLMSLAIGKAHFAPTIRSISLSLREVRR